MKIGILYIALGNYSVMWPEFYESAKKHFFINEKTHFYVFTDDKTITNNQDIDVLETRNMGWPGNTLYRFKLFTSISDRLKQYDYLFFFNANAMFVSDVGEDILPKNGEKLISVQHFVYKNKHPAYIQYDRNKKSTAYVPWKHEPKEYCQACLLGGEGKAFLEMCEILSNNIDIDDKNGVCALWHDESHFNHYIMDHEVRVLPQEYAFPEFKLTDGYLPLILMRDKERYANTNVLRNGKKRSFFGKVAFKFSNFKVKFKCFIHRLFWRFYK